MPEQPAKPDWRMGGITVPQVEDYLYSMLPPRDEVLAEMEADAVAARRGKERCRLVRRHRGLEPRCV